MKIFYFTDEDKASAAYDAVAAPYHAILMGPVATVSAPAATGFYDFPPTGPGTVYVLVVQRDKPDLEAVANFAIPKSATAT